jgi:hypothetical protein
MLNFNSRRVFSVTRILSLVFLFVLAVSTQTFAQTKSIGLDAGINLVNSLPHNNSAKNVVTLEIKESPKGPRQICIPLPGGGHVCF